MFVTQSLLNLQNLSRLGIYKSTGIPFPPVKDALVQWLGGTYTETDQWYQKDKSGRAGTVYDGSYLQMNGTDNYYKVNLDIGTTWDIEVEFTKRTATVVGTFLTKQAATTDLSIDVSGGNIRGFFYSGASPYILSTPIAPYDDDNVHTIRYTHDGTTTNLYVDGVLVATDTFGVSANDTTTDVYIGNRITITYINADLHSVKFLNVAEYYFDEKDGDTVFDASGNGNHGTLQGTLTNIRQEDASIYSYINEFGYNEGGTVQDELVTNGTFDTDTNWTKAASVTISGGKAIFVSSSSSTALYQGIGTQENKTMEVVYTISNYASGSILFRFFGDAGGGLGTSRSSNGTFVETIDLTTGHNGNFGFSSTSFTGDIEIVSVKEAYDSTTLIPADQTSLSNDVIGNTLANKGKVAYDPQLVESNIASFDGVGNYYKLSGVFQYAGATPSVDITVKFSTTSTGTFKVLYSEGSSNTTAQNFRISTDNGQLRVALRDDGSNVLINDLLSITTGLNDGAEHTLRWVDNNGAAEMYIDGVLDGRDFSYTPVSTFTMNQTGVGALVRTLDDLFYDGKIHRVTTSNFDHGFGEGSGVIVYDKLGNGNNGTLNGILTNFWSTANSRPHNLLDGFTQGLRCTTSGTAYRESAQAYGVWEFAFDPSVRVEYVFINSSNENAASANTNGYNIILLSDGRIFFREITAGSVSGSFNTDFGYIPSGEYPMLKVQRNSVENEYHVGPVNSFALYIKGGSFGNDYVLVDTTGGGGTNPITLSTHTTSNYSVLDIDATDEVSNSKQGGSTFDLFEFFNGTGVYERVYYPIDPTATGEALSNPGIGDTGQGHNGAETKYLQPEAQALIDVESNFDYKPWFGVNTSVGGTFGGTNGTTTSSCGSSYKEGCTLTFTTTGAATTTGTALLNVLTAGKEYYVYFEAKSSDLISHVISSVGDASNTATAIKTQQLNSEWQSYIYKITPTQTALRIYFTGSISSIGDVLQYRNIQTKEVTDTTPVGCPYEVISYDYELKGRWFADVISKNPIKFNWAVYSSQITEPELTDVYKFMKSVEALSDSEGQLLFDSEGHQLYALKEDLV